MKQRGAVRPVFGDPKLLFQVFSNLISNAVKYSDDGRRIDDQYYSLRDRLGRGASAVLKNLVRRPKRTFSTLSAMSGRSYQTPITLRRTWLQQNRDRRSTLRNH